MDDYDRSAALEDYYSYNFPAVPPYGTTNPPTRRDGYPAPLSGFELQPSETCPKNFIIFDQNENNSRIMFHPTLAQKLNYQDIDFGASYAHGYDRNQGRYKNNHCTSSASVKEDSDDIDALLSLEGEEEDDDDADEDDDVISTGRTPHGYGVTSSGSVCSADDSKSQKLKFPSQSSSSNAITGRKKERMRTMVKTLRGIIPGGDQMDTPAVLDEAVRYLKSLKMEVKKLNKSKT